MEKEVNMMFVPLIVSVNESFTKWFATGDQEVTLQTASLTSANKRLGSPIGQVKKPLSWGSVREGRPYGFILDNLSARPRPSVDTLRDPYEPLLKWLQLHTCRWELYKLVRYCVEVVEKNVQHLEQNIRILQLSLHFIFGLIKCAPLLLTILEERC